VFAQGVSLPVTLLPVPGSGTLVAGVQDSTAYATWYQDQPPGQYPAALGSGAAQFAAATTLVTFQSRAILAAPASVTFGGASGFSIGGFGSVAVNFSSATALGALRLAINWLDSAGAIVGTRLIDVVNGQGGAKFRCAHEGPFVQFVVTNTLALAQSYFLGVTQLLGITEGWDTQTGLTDPSFIAGPTGTAVGANSTTTVLTALCTYAGHAVLKLNLAGIPTFQVNLNATQFGLGVDVLASWFTGDLSPQGNTVEVWLPAMPVNVVLINNSALTPTINAGIYADDWHGV